jgi:nucleoside phosphorylase
MEAYGVMLAAQELPYPQPECFVLKGVSDFADKEKDDRFRHFAAHMSAQLLRLMCEDFKL